MRIRDSKSIIIIFVYLVLNSAIIFASWQMKPDLAQVVRTAKSLAPEFTEIETLDYFHLKSGIPQMSLSAVKMRSQGEEKADFDMPTGVYNLQDKNKTVFYRGEFGSYKKKNELLTLTGDVEVTTEESKYYADKIRYFFKKDLILGKGNVKFEGDDLKSKDHVTIHSDTMRAHPEAQTSKFSGNVSGVMERKKKYEGKMTFSSRELHLDGNTSLAHLEGDVVLIREGYKLTAGKGDIYLENFNKSLKYFVMNDDVKMTEKIQTKEGLQERRAFSERLEGFGKEQKMVLSGAPRVETGPDVIRGYRITVRENVDLMEVDDAMSDMQVKRKKLKE